MVLRKTPPKRIFFDQTRRVREMEWEHGFRSNPIKRFFSGKKRIEKLKAITYLERTVSDQRVIINQMKDVKEMPGVAFFSHPEIPYKSMREAIIWFWAGAYANRKNMDRTVPIVLFTGRREESLPIGNARLMFNPATHETTITVTFDPIRIDDQGALPRACDYYASYFSSKNWEPIRGRDPRTGQKIDGFTFSTILSQRELTSMHDYEMYRAELNQQLKEYAKTYSKRTKKSKK